MKIKCIAGYCFNNERPGGKCVLVLERYRIRQSVYRIMHGIMHEVTMSFLS